MERSRVLPVLVLLAGTVAFLSSLDLREWQVIGREFAVGFTLRVVGGAAAVAGLVGVLALWAAGAGAARLAPGGVVILAGLAVSSPSWATAIGLAAVLAAAVAWPRGPGAEPPATPDRGDMS